MIPPCYLDTESQCCQLSTSNEEKSYSHCDALTSSERTCVTPVGVLSNSSISDSSHFEAVVPVFVQGLECDAVGVLLNAFRSIY